MVSPFGRQLCAALEAAHLSQNVFAKSVGISQGTLSRIISGSRKPPADAVIAWAQRLNLAGDDETAFIQAALLAAEMPLLASRLLNAEGRSKPKR